MSEKLHAAAVLSVLNTALAPKVAYDAHKIPATRPAEYVEIFLYRRFGGEALLSVRKSLSGWRVTVRAISQTSVDNVRLMLDKAETALQYVPLAVNGEMSTPPQFETAEPVSENSGWFTGSRDYTYTIRA